MESPGLESPMDGEDAVYPCKGCGEILEEGKAFELAGNRWHIDCFRCNTCGTLLDSDANLLLLGDGSLICNNCTYSCNACGNKIEDLAILTGDQAFCASCFRCRNCKRKIENLRYARTSQGIFCMSCHESLMARRRKKNKGARSVTGGTNGPGSTTTATPSTTVEKALPSLPPGAASEAAFSPEIETPPTDQHAGTPGGRSINTTHTTRTLRSEKDAPPSHYKRDVSPLSDEMRRDGQTLPASTYKEGRRSRMSSISDDDENEGFLPMSFDPNPARRPPPAAAIPRKRVPPPNEVSPVDPPPPRDYFTGRTSSKPPHRELLREDRPGSARSDSTEREPILPPNSAGQPKSSPHIAYQEKSRTQKRLASGQSTPASSASPAIGGAQDRPERPKPQTLDTSSFTLGRGDGFKLQEVPKAKKSSSRSELGKENKSPSLVSPIDHDDKEHALDRTVTASPVSAESPQSGINPFDDPRRKEGHPSAHAPALSRFPDRPARGDSLAASSLKPSSIRSSPEPPTATTVATSLKPSHGRHESASSIPSSFVDSQTAFARDNRRSKTVESPHVRSSFDAIPPRASSRPSGPSKSAGNNGDFVTPRQPPPPPPAERHRAQESISSTQPSSDARSDGQLSPPLRSAGLPKHSMDGAFSMEEEMARILRGDKAQDRTEASMLRRVSNAVKHGRSFSDRGVPKNGAPIESSLNTPLMISSPMMSSPSSKDTMDSMRAALRRAQSKIAELEAQNSTLEERASGSSDIKQVNSELREKRTTMAFLDTQREMVVRELEVMTDHLGKVKDNNQPLDLTALNDSIFRELSESLRKLKDHMGGQIEDLMRKRTDLTDEIGNLIQMKDRGFQEYESLSSKNAQLLEMNNNLLQSIQELYKSNRGNDSGKHGNANGLGIYHPGTKESLHEDFMPGETEAEPATVLTAPTGPQVVNIRKGQPKKFNWRKGGEKMAKNVTKGLKGAFATERVQTRDGYEIGTPYGMTQQAVGGGEAGSFSAKQGGPAPGAAGFGFFGQKNGGLKNGQAGSMKNSSSTNLAIPSNDPSVLFGSELELRCEFENRLIPAIVGRCVEEVEKRGMDAEGVYRKSGGSGQVKAIQAGFEKDPNNYDISDPDLDIHAVTSALKQYFRKLPTPLITYDVYDSLLEAGALSNIGVSEGEDKDSSKTQALIRAATEKQVLALRSAVSDLPEHHRNCLEYLVLHLRRVMKSKDENLMTSLNLAVVFAPTIMRPSSIEREMSDMLAQRTAVQALLDLGAAVFEADDEESDDE